MIQSKNKTETGDIPISNLIDIVRGPNVTTYEEITNNINKMFGLNLTISQVYLSENPTIEEMEEDYKLIMKHHGY